MASSKSPQKSNVPPGVDRLLSFDRLRINVVAYSQAPVLSDFRFLRSLRCYLIENSPGQPLLRAYEDPDTGGHDIKFLPLRVFVMDGKEEEFMTIDRLASYPPVCCGRVAELTAPSGTTFGYVHLKKRCCCPSIYVEDGQHQLHMCIGVPFRLWLCGTCTQIVFPIYARDWKNKIGQIVRARGACGFDVSFPIDLDTRMKAVLVGATIFLPQSQASRHLK